MLVLREKVEKDKLSKCTVNSVSMHSILDDIIIHSVCKMHRPKQSKAEACIYIYSCSLPFYHAEKESSDL